MAKDFIVVFTKTNARVLVNPPEMGIMLRDHSAVLNPDLKHVKNVPPHFWKMEYGVVAPMSDEERNARIKYIQEVGVDNTVITSEIVNKDPYPNLKGEIETLGTEVARLRTELESSNIKITQKDNELDRVSSALLEAGSINDASAELIEDKMETIMSMAKHQKYCHVGIVALMALWVAQVVITFIR